MRNNTNNVVIVRSLRDSDLGLFAAHRPSISSKQRALNINSVIATQLLSPKIIKVGQAQLMCRIIFGDTELISERKFYKADKNWRLGGDMIKGEVFQDLVRNDFALIHSVKENDGTGIVTIVFVSKLNQSFTHSVISRLVDPVLSDSMGIFLEGSAGFDKLMKLFPDINTSDGKYRNDKPNVSEVNDILIPLMPRENRQTKRVRSIKEKIQSPHVLEQMLKVSVDMSAPAQASFIETVEDLALQLREVLLASNRIISLKKDHKQTWESIKGESIGFVDGGLANLSMLGSAPIAARVGGYIVKPGDTTKERERFIVLKKLINELYSSDTGGVYNGVFPDLNALRDAARISIEAAGAVRLLSDDPSIKFLFLHGALVNPVSRYTDLMYNGEPRFHFPNFSCDALKELLPTGARIPTGRNSNFISVYLKQLEALNGSRTSICGVIEREATTSSVIRAVLNSLEDDIIVTALGVLPAEWKRNFKGIVDPADENEMLGPRITDSLLFRCVLEPGEALLPVEIDRNEMRRAPVAWQDVIVNYPKPLVSYLQPSEWSAPIRLEIFEKDHNEFESIANLIFHCSLLLPRYAFPAGLDIVDKFVKIPSWMSKPINTNVAVQALKTALDKGDEKVFDSLRRMLCGSKREWFLRPGINK